MRRVQIALKSQLTRRLTELQNELRAKVQVNETLLIDNLFSSCFCLVCVLLLFERSVGSHFQIHLIHVS